MNSPFIYKPGTILEEPPEKIIKMSDMNQLVKNSALDEVDIKVMRAIHEHRFLTAGLVDQYFKNDGFFSQSFAKNKMRKFVKYGIVRRFYITFEGNEAIHKRTVNFYALTDAAMLYLKKYLGFIPYKINIGDFSNVGDVLSILALNQASINYSQRITSYTGIEYDRCTMPRSLLVKMLGKEYKILCVRKDQRYDRLLEKINSDKAPVDNLLLLVEDELSATEIFTELEGKSSRPVINFITDLMMISSDMYDSYLNLVRKGSNISIVEYKLNGSGGDMC